MKTQQITRAVLISDTGINVISVYMSVYTSNEITDPVDRANARFIVKDIIWRHDTETHIGNVLKATLRRVPDYPEAPGTPISNLLSKHI